MVALAHGTNDAQKTMGVISLALIANGSIAGGDDFDVPDLGRRVAARRRSRSGTYCGGWRIIKTLGTKVVEVRPPQGFGSETVAASVILASSHVGFPLSTTQVVSGAVAGSGRRPAGRRGQLARRAATSSSAGCSRCRRRLPWRPSSTASSTLLGGGAARRDRRQRRAWSSPAFLLWRANRAKPIEPEETVSEHPAFGPPRARAGGGMTLRLDRRLGQAARRRRYVSAAFGIGVILIGGLAVVASLRSPGPPPRRSGRRDRARRRHRRVRARHRRRAIVLGIYIMTNK